MEGQDVVLGKMKYKKDAKVLVDLLPCCFPNSSQHLLPRTSDACNIPC